MICMADKEMFNINITVNGVRMPLHISRDDEVIYRNAEKLFNKYFRQYSEVYSQRSMEEILTLVAYQFAYIVSKQSMNQDVEPLAEKIQQLNNQLRELMPE